MRRCDTCRSCSLKLEELERVLGAEVERVGVVGAGVLVLELMLMLQRVGVVGVGVLVLELERVLGVVLVLELERVLGAVLVLKFGRIVGVGRQNDVGLELERVL